MKRTSFLSGLSVALVLGLTSAARAASWPAGWKDPPVASGRALSAAEREQARQLGEAIDSAETALLAIQAWEQVAAARPDDADAWVEIGILRLLEGAAFRSSAAERLVCYRAALQACERAMATNPEFLRRVQAGRTTAEAAGALGSREMAAMHSWSTGVFYLFRDCLGLFGRIMNVRLLEGAKTMLERMDEVNPAWEDHVSTFSWGIYYLAMPVSRGGDRAKARACFDRAVAMGERRLLPRWGRAKYFYVAVGEPAAARADLEAVVARDLDGLGGHRAWNRYFQMEAKRLLAR
jgi:tetratricopeptide (TPR) repeat protein